MKTKQNVKNLTLGFILIGFAILWPNISQAQGIWTKKANVGPGAAKRFASIGFSIGTKGYIGSGVTMLLNDFWEWDQATNKWTQKADFTGGYRLLPVGFSIGNKGYLGTGDDGDDNYYNNFWEWNQAQDTWVQKASFGGAPRSGAFGFSIGTKGYIGGGGDSSKAYFDFWEWNQATNVWTKKAPFPGLTPAGSAFTIGTKGYVVSGNELWEWNQATNVWTQKSSIAGGNLYRGVCFSISTKGYYGTGTNGTDEFKDFWEWNQITDVWTKQADFGGTGRGFAAGFSIGTKGYLGTGRDTSSAYLLNDFWEFAPAGSGLEEFIESDFNLFYPNPSSGKFIFKTPIEKGDISIYTISGELILHWNIQELKNNTIDISSLNSGIYLVQINTDKKSVTQKIIVSK